MNSYGVISEVPGMRLYDFESVCGASETNLPKTYILPDDKIPSVRDQGTVGACVAFSLAEMLEVFNYNETGNLVL